MTEQKVIFDKTLEYLGKNDKNRSNKSDKFYQIVITMENTTLFIETRTWGKYGTKGQSMTINHYDDYRALRSANKQLTKKRNKGYTNSVNALTRLATIADD